MVSAVGRFAGPNTLIRSAWLPGNHRPGDRALQHAKGDQRGQAPGEPAEERGDREQRDRQHEGAHHAEALHQPAGQGHRDAVRHRERGDHPGALIGAHAQVPADGGDGDVRDRGVEHLHEGAERQGHGGHRLGGAARAPAPVAAMAGVALTASRHQAASPSLAASAAGRRDVAAARSRMPTALRLRCAGSFAFGPALSAMIDAMRASTAGSSPALACRGSGTLRTAVAHERPRRVVQIDAHRRREADPQRMRL